MKFSITTKGFYTDDINYGDNLPSDATEISSETEANLRNAISLNLPIIQKEDGEIVIATSDCDVWNADTEQFELDEQKQQEKDEWLQTTLTEVDDLTANIGCSVTRTAAQSIPANIETLINFTSENYDTDGMHDNSTNNTRITVKSAGIYILTIRGKWGNDSTGNRYTNIKKNGTSLADRWDNAALTSEFMYSILVDADVDDYFETSIYQTTSGALDLDYNKLNFAMQRISV